MQIVFPAEPTVVRSPVAGVASAQRSVASGQRAGCLRVRHGGAGGVKRPCFPGGFDSAPAAATRAACALAPALQLPVLENTVPLTDRSLQPIQSTRHPYREQTEMNRREQPVLSPRQVIHILAVHSRRWLVPAAVVAVLVGVYALVRPAMWEASQALIVRNEAANNEVGPGKFSRTDEMKTVQETILELSSRPRVPSSARPRFST